MIELRRLPGLLPVALTNATEPSLRSRTSISRRSDRTPQAGTSREDAALRRVRAVSRLLDDAFRVPGTSLRIGLDPLVGVLPVGGDAVMAAISLYPILEAYRFGVPRRTLAKMLTLVAIDALIGSVPVLGTIFDAFWKANRWNVATLEAQLGAARET